MAFMRGGQVGIGVEWRVRGGLGFPLNTFD